MLSGLVPATFLMEGMLAAPCSAPCCRFRCFELNAASNPAVGGPNPATSWVLFGGWRDQAHEGPQGVSALCQVCLHTRSGESMLVDE